MRRIDEGADEVVAEVFEVFRRSSGFIGEALEADVEGLASPFDQPVAVEDDGRAALQAGNVDPARAVVVGDSIWDVQSARAAGLPTIGVESGGFSRHELAEEGALAVYRHVEDLRNQWQTSPLGQLRS